MRSYTAFDLHRRNLYLGTIDENGKRIFKWLSYLIAPPILSGNDESLETTFIQNFSAVKDPSRR